MNKIIKRRAAAGFLAAALAALCLALAGAASLTAAAEIPSEGTVTLAVSQALAGDSSSIPAGAVFVYRLTPDEDGNPMPDGSCAGSYDFTASGNETVSVGPISFDATGIYTYQLSCVTPSFSNCAADQQIYTVEVYVTNDLTPLSVIYLSDGDKAPDISFTQVYSPLPAVAPDDGTFTISGTVTWIYGDASEKDRPQSVTITIKNGDTVVKVLTVTAADNWKWSAEVPRYDADGNEIVYTVFEGNVPCYTHTVNGYDVTNTYVSARYPGDKPTQTGVDANLLLWISATAGSALLLWFLFWGGKRSKEKKKQPER